MCARLPRDFGPIGAHFSSESMDGVGLRTQLMDDKSLPILMNFLSLILVVQSIL
jgi:hypothetical protein